MGGLNGLCKRGAEKNALVELTWGDGKNACCHECRLKILAITAIVKQWLQSSSQEYELAHLLLFDMDGSQQLVLWSVLEFCLSMWLAFKCCASEFGTSKEWQVGVWSGCSDEVTTGCMWIV